ncbi:MAG: S-methyl-5-thioribose-1-phosphate isomerase [Bacteroidales bacterium]|nr:S-methyl-5-thioribose-1-phosphate isomerase [Bacteroidales bacterium]
MNSFHSTSPCSLWVHPDDNTIIQILDQRFLPFTLITEDLKTDDDCLVAIRDMHVRGAPLIGVTAAFGIYLGLLHCGKGRYDTCCDAVVTKLAETRPTAVNLFYALEFVRDAVLKEQREEAKPEAAFRAACTLMEREIAACRRIGEYGLSLVEEAARKKKGDPVRILTHCNAGWLACIRYGTATAPIYLAHEKGISVHVWVDETRPLNQGSRLTAWELEQAGVPHTVITDNAGGYLMQKGMVDMVIVGSDRVCLNGDIANKTGTYLKALAASDNHIPFYVAFPSSTIDTKLESGEAIPIEERSSDEVHFMTGFGNNGLQKIRITPFHSEANNPAFDITPARLITGFITERGVCQPNRKDILQLFPEIA